MSPEPTGEFKEDAEDLNTAADVRIDVNGSEPMTEAERAVAEVLRSVWCDAHFVNSELVRLDSWKGQARAVVAAVRPLLAAEALDKIANALDKEARARRHNVMHGTSTESFEFIEGIEHAAEMVETRRAALRTTTPEHKGDPR